MKLKDRFKQWLFSDELEAIEHYLKALQVVIVEQDAEITALTEENKGINKDIFEIRGLAGDFQEALDIAKASALILTNAEKDISKKLERVESVSDSMEKVLGTIEVAVDVHEVLPESWAVICVNGDPSYLKLVDLRKKEIMEISKFLRQFEYSHKSIDASPWTYGNCFMDGGRH